MTIPAFAGYSVLFAAIFLGELGVPLFVPAELLLIAAGVAAANGAASLPVVVGLAIAADLLGGMALFLLVRLGRGRSGRLGRLERFVERATSTAHALGADSPLRVAAGRCIPFVRIPSALAAALAGLPLPSFAGALVTGGTIWVAAFLGGGYLLTKQALEI